MLNEITGFDVRLYEKMAELGMSQADLCRLTGLASSMVSHYCTSQRIPSVPVAAKIARALNTTIEYLAFGDDARLDGGGLRRDDGQRGGDARLDGGGMRGGARDSTLTISENSVSFSVEHTHEQDDGEETLNQLYSLLNTTGREKVLEYIKDLLSTGKYN